VVLVLELDVVFFAILAVRAMRNCIPMGFFMVGWRVLLNFVPYWFETTQLPLISLFILFHPDFQTLNGRDCHKRADILSGGDTRWRMNYWERIWLWSDLQLGHTYPTRIPFLIIFFTAEFFICLQSLSTWLRLLFDSLFLMNSLPDSHYNIHVIRILTTQRFALFDLRDRLQTRLWFQVSTCFAFSEHFYSIVEFYQFGGWFGGEILEQTA